MSAVGIEAQVITGFIDYIRSLSFTPVVGISVPGVGYDPQVGTPFIEMTVLFNTTDNVAIAYDSGVELRGLTQISVFWPSNEGQIKPFNLASQVVANFPRGKVILTGTIEIRIADRDDQSEVSNSIEETDWLQVPVTIPWRVVAPAPTI